MPADQKDRYIHCLVDKVNELDLDKRAMELAVEEFLGIHTRPAVEVSAEGKEQR